MRKSFKRILSGSVCVATALVALLFGFSASAQSTYSLGGCVFLDHNNNGLLDLDEDAGIAGVEIAVFQNSAGGPGWSAVTDPDGFYRVDGLPAGDYIVTIFRGQFYDYPDRPLNGLRSSLGAAPAPDPNNGIAGIDYGYEPGTAYPYTTIATGVIHLQRDNLNVDLGFTSQLPTVSVGGVVFRDMNGNGVQDVLEPGIAGVQVSIYIGDRSWGEGAGLVLTDADGKYQFSGLPAAQYSAVVGKENFFYFPDDWNPGDPTRWGNFREPVSFERWHMAL